MAKLQEKIALVTGASRNIGKSIALRFAQEGADLAIASKTGDENLTDTASRIKALGRRVFSEAVDVADGVALRAYVKRAQEHFGRIDILVHTVAIRPHGPYESVTEQQWSEVRGTILDSAFHITQAVLPGMRERGYGRIVLFNGIGAFKGAAERAHVSAAKMGISGLARGLASEYAPHGVRINVIAPGAIDTARANPEWYGGSPPSAKGIPMNRMGKPEEIAAGCLFLVDDDCGFITGETMQVNGGQLFV